MEGAHVYTSVIANDFKPGTAQTVIQRIEDGIVPELKGQPGFQHYRAIQSGADAFVTIIDYDTEAHAEASFRHMAAVMRQQLDDLLEGMQRYAGPVLHSEAP